MDKLDKLDVLVKLAEDIEGIQSSMNYHAELVEELKESNVRERGQIEALPLTQRLAAVEIENSKLKPCEGGGAECGN